MPRDSTGELHNKLEKLGRRAKLVKFVDSRRISRVWAKPRHHKGNARLLANQKFRLEANQDFDNSATLLQDKVIMLPRPAIKAGQ